jgi:hypothetical protein
MGEIVNARILHAHVFVRVVDFLEFRIPEIAVAKCKLDVHLRFSGLAFRIVQLGK